MDHFINTAKIVITSKELFVIQNTDFILTKNSVFKKIHILLEEIRNELENIATTNQHLLPAELDINEGKISRGENYKGLPFLILDYPKLFKKNSTFAFRSLFLWGNFFSCTLHLEGNLLLKFENKLKNNYQALRNKHWYFCINSNPWEHLYDSYNYKQIEQIDLEIMQNQIKNHQFIKLSTYIELTKVNSLKKFVTNTFKEVIEVLNN